MDLINKSKLDPISMYTTMKIALMLTREEMALPDKDDEDEEDDDVQRAKLIQVCMCVCVCVCEGVVSAVCV